MLTIDDSVRELYPGAKMGILAVKDASCSSFMTDEEVAEFLQDLSRKYAHLERKESGCCHPRQEQNCCRSTAKNIKCVK